MQSPKRILITGGSGMIGTHLTTLLQAKGYEVSHLGRSRKQSSVRTFLWDLQRKTLDPEALRNVDVIVHLSGAGVADKRWNERRKKEILSSRADTARLLLEGLRANPDHQVKTLVSASGISYYGLGAAAHDAFTEADAPASDFMAGVTVAWEKEVKAAEDLGIRTVMLRTGVVLAREGGALEKLAKPVRFFVGAPLGSGKQYVNWIHITDLCNLYVRAIEDPSMTGPYNAVAPHPVTNRVLTQGIAKALHRPLWVPPVPGFAVRLIAGDVADVVLEGGKVSAKKITDLGFEFTFSELQPALQDLLA